MTDDPAENAEPLPVATSTTTTTAPGTQSTAPAGERLCGLLTQADLDAVAPGLRLAPGSDATERATIGSTGAEAACEWLVSAESATFELTLVVATDVTSADYEEVLADPQLGDPSTVGDLGEVASAGGMIAGLETQMATAYVLVYERQRLVQLTSNDAAALGRDPLVALARMLLPRA